MHTAIDLMSGKAVYSSVLVHECFSMYGMDQGSGLWVIVFSCGFCFEGSSGILVIV